LLSKRAPSTTRPSLRTEWNQQFSVIPQHDCNDCDHDLVTKRKRSRMRRARMSALPVREELCKYRPLIGHTRCRAVGRRSIGPRRTSSIASDPYMPVGRKNLDTATNDVHHTLLLAGEPVPLAFSVCAGEVIHHLRSALDHLVWQLIECAPGMRAHTPS
jgi:hypothetical protein